MAAKYDVKTRREAIRLLEEGNGKGAISTALAIPVSTVEKWILHAKAVGIEDFLSMDARHRSYDFETKVQAASDFVDNGMTRQEVMTKYGISNLTSLKNWVRKYRVGGADALVPKPKGRPRKNPDDPPPERPREQVLEDECNRLRAEVAYLKKLRALEAEKRTSGKNAR